MTFAHPLLLGGLLLIGIPVLIHLIMQQKPKHLLFPAFRFLVQRHRENQRRLKLRHLLLLLLRIGLIVLMCLALARPRVKSDSINFVAGQPVALALVFDTSPSMEYKLGEKSRLAEAKQRTLELLEELPSESRVAVFDTADVISGHWQESLPLARKTVADLQIRYANHAVTDVLDLAYRLLATADDDKTGGDSLPCFLYVFSDRTRDSWDERRLPVLQALRDARPPPRVQAIFIDVGVEKPENLAVLDLKLPRQAVAANQPVLINARVQATGRDYDTVLLCRFDGERDAERKPIKVPAGQQVGVSFERKGLKPGLHRVEVSLETPDNLPFSAVQFATVEVRGPRRVLTICDDPGGEAKDDDPKAILTDPGDAAVWKLALDKHGQFQCKVISSTAADRLGLNDLSQYQAVCLLDVRRPSEGLWEKLWQYVQTGGGLAILPGGKELDRSAYDSDDVNASVLKLMPGRFTDIIEDKDGARWHIENFQHGLMAPFREWGMAANVDFIKVPRRAFRYWQVKSRDGKDVLPLAEVIVPYDIKGHPPALLERKFDKSVRGRVLLFTTTMDGRRGWNDYLELGGSFYLALANKTVGYLAGDDDAVRLNYLTGETVTVPLPVKPRFGTYTLQLPGNAPAVVLSRPNTEHELRVTPEQAAQPGSYTLLGADRVWQTGFSLNVPEGECQLARVPAEKIEALFGPGAVLPVGPVGGLREKLQEHWSQPIDLFPWLMIALLLVLAVENLMANRFYRREPAATAEKS